MTDTAEQQPTGSGEPSGAPGKGGRASPGPGGASSQADADFPVVGIGASAGGLHALEALFQALDPHTGMAFVVVSHLAPAHPSALPTILAHWTPMPVIEVTDGIALEADTVFVLPPGWDMTTERGRLHLQTRAEPALHRPIDLFFRSLCDDRRHQAIGVVLSGTATDGTLGIRAIKAMGGITFAQDDSARQPSMPQSAIADGHVDFVLPPGGIAEELLRISRLPRVTASAAVPSTPEHGSLTAILDLVEQQTGVDFRAYKENTLRRRLQRRMILKRVTSLDAYLALLREQSDEVRALHDDLLIGVTSFFRDPDAFDALAKKAFPTLMARERPQEPIRLWVLGCSTGEEAYSLAMALTEAMGQANVHLPLQIFASDVNAAGIRIARAAVYPADIAQDLSPERLARFFTPVDGHYRVVKSIRDACIFSRHNVLTDPPYSRIDFVSCRNLLMYLQPALQHDVIRSLHYALVPEGLLWLGSADTVGTHSSLFEVIDPPHRIYRRRLGTSSHPARTVRATRTGYADALVGQSEQPISDLLKDSDRLLLARYAPPAVLMSTDMEVLQYRGDVGRYISPASGKASHQLTQVLDRRLHVPVRALLTAVAREHRAMRDDSISLLSPEGEEQATPIEIVPVGSPIRGYLLLFPHPERPGPDHALLPRSKRLRGPARGDAIARLTKELADTRLYLEAVIERQDAAREELEIAHEQAQSANEELQSINEELETSKEEIQSANEELQTLNDELQHRNGELQHINSDLGNLLTSTDMAVLFIGPDLTIRRFTPAAGRLLGLRSSDVGRDLRELRLPLHEDIERLVTETIASADSRDHEAPDRDGRWRSVRIRPYRTTDNAVDGAVVVFVDVDAAVRARLYAESIIATVRTPLVVVDDAFRVATANRAFLEVSGVAEQAVHGQPLFSIGGGRWDHADLRRVLQGVQERKDAVHDLALEFSDGRTSRAWMVNARPMPAQDDRPLTLLSLEDVSEREHMERLRRDRLIEMAAAERNKDEFLAMLAHELRNPLAPIRAAAAVLGQVGVSPAAMEHMRAILERQVQHMVCLVDDLLNVARITQGKLDLRFDQVDLVRIAQSAIDAVRPIAEAREQHLSQSLPSERLMVRGDATRLEQAFGNLLQNASKFTARGGHIGVHLGTASDGQTVRVDITDDGIGIEPGMLPHVFELFRQVGPSPHQVAGLGVGLALVQRIVELHGGRVEMHSDGAGHGTQCCITLPLLRSATAPDAVATSPAALNGHAPLRLLVVDDNADAASSLLSLLQAAGHDARSASNGQAALELAPQFLPDVVLLDIAMPGMDGYEVARRLRQMPVLDATALVAVTGYGREEDRRRAFEAGFDRFVTKPVDPAGLPDLLRPRGADGAPAASPA